MLPPRIPIESMGVSSAPWSLKRGKYAIALLWVFWLNTGNLWAQNDYNGILDNAREVVEQRKELDVAGLLSAISDADKSQDSNAVLTGYVLLSIYNINLSRIDSTRSYLTKARQYLTDDGTPSQVGGYYGTTAQLNYFMGQSDSAIWYLEKCLQIYEKAADTVEITTTLNNMSVLYAERGEHFIELDLLLKVLDLRTKSRDTLRLVSTLVNIGNCYLETGNPKMGLEYFDRVLVGAKGKVAFLRLLGLQGRADANMLLGNHEEIEPDLLEIYSDADSPRQKAKALNGLGELELTRGNYSKALKLLLEAQSFEKEARSYLLESQTLLLIGKVEAKMQNYIAAKAHLLESIQLSDKYDFLVAEEAARLSLSHVYRSLSDFENALIQMELANELADSMRTREQSLKLSELKTKYETELTTKENEALKAGTAADKAEIQAKSFQNYLFMAVGIALLMVALLLFLRYKSSQRSKVLLEDKNDTIQKQADELRSVERIKSQFFANVSHELRTPLTLMLGPLEQLISGTEKYSAITKANLSLVFNSSKRMKELVDEVLDVTKLENDKLELQLSVVNLERTLKVLGDSFESMAASKGVSYEVDSQIEQNVLVRLDKDKVQKIVSNLLSNAIKFSDSGGEVKMLTTFSEPNVVTIQVSDQGVGLSEDDQLKVFSRHFQTKKGVEKGGLGIGLTLSQEFAKLMGGRIDVKSSIGVGSTFTFRFNATREKPILESQETFVDPINFTFGDELANRSLRVLVVDDNAEMRQYLRGIFSGYFKVFSAENGRAAIEVLETKKIDLVASDAMMPEVDGFELLKEVRQNTRWSTLPFIMITARGDEDSKIRALDSGVDDYVTKPFYSRELLARAHNVLRNSFSRLEAKDDDDVLESADDSFMSKLKEVVEKHLGEADFNVERLADLTFTADRTLNRRIKSATGLTPAHYIKEQRLLAARSLLESQVHRSVSEVAVATGYGQTRTFSKQFFNRFGKYPSEYFKQHTWSGVGLNFRPDLQRRHVLFLPFR